MKKVLIISPHFPPVNTADMHRVRQSLPYFKEMGWEAVVICVDEAYVEAYSIDPLLMYTVPEDIEVHRVKAFSAKFTRKFGIGSLSIRSYWQIKRKGNELLKANHFDLIYFSTTAFHVMALGPGWKKRFGVPFIIDIQDPWCNDFYLDKPIRERPPKFFIAHNIDKLLEAYTLPKVDGIISVSKSYCDTFIKRYHVITETQCRVITFGASLFDLEIMKKFLHQSEKVKFSLEKFNVVYIGTAVNHMKFSLQIVFKAFAKGLIKNEALFANLHFWFVGTSYNKNGLGAKTIEPIAIDCFVDKYVTEITDRIPYFETLFLLDKADMLLVPGSTDKGYTASKIYPYLMIQKPLLALFSKFSSVIDVLKQVGNKTTVKFNTDDQSPDEYTDECLQYLELILKMGKNVTTGTLKDFEPFTAKEKTKEQADFFNEVVKQFNNHK